jgi:hypothetical protein
MKLQTVIDILGIETENSLEDLKTKYRNLAKRYHPDLVGDRGNEIMQMVNEAYKEASDRWNDLKDYLMSGKPSTGNELLGDKLLRAYETLKRIPGIELELIGSWLWITGDTKPVKEVIKEAGKEADCGVGFSKTKLAWYIKPEKYHRKGKGVDWDTMRATWGSQRLDKEEDRAVA